MTRSIADIDTELDAVHRERCKLEDIHDALQRERRTAIAARNRAMIADFDAGHTVRRIAADHAVPLMTAYNILRDAGRRSRDRVTPISHLPAEQQRAYHKARAFGIEPDAARQMATTAARTVSAAAPVAADATPRAPVATIPFTRTHTQRLPTGAEIRAHAARG